MGKSCRWGKGGTGDGLICPVGSRCRLVAKLVPEQPPPERPVLGVKRYRPKLLAALQPFATVDAKNEEKHPLIS